jgi:hypothetical protein
MKLLKLQYNEFNININIITVNGLQKECRAPMSQTDRKELANSPSHYIISMSHGALQEIQISCTIHLF